MQFLTFFDHGVKYLVPSAIFRILFSYFPDSFINVSRPTQFTEGQKYAKCFFFFFWRHEKLNPWSYEMHKKKRRNAPADCNVFYNLNMYVLLYSLYLVKLFFKNSTVLFSVTQERVEMILVKFTFYISCFFCLLKEDVIYHIPNSNQSISESPNIL